jgi:hypothetical protein
MVRVAHWRRKDAIQIGRQERLLGRPAKARNGVKTFFAFFESFFVAPIASGYFRAFF